MKKKRTALVVVSILLFYVFMAGNLIASDSEKKDRVLLSVGTTNKTSSAYGFYVASLEVFKKYAPHLQATIIETGASIDNLTRIKKGQLSYGLSSFDAAYQNYEGLGRWEGRANRNIRVLLMWTKNAVPYVVRADSGISNPKELDGKKFSPGMRGSGNEAMCEAVLETLDIKPKFFRGSLKDAADAMKDDRIVGTNKTSVGLRPDATFLDLQTFIELKPLHFTEEQVQKVQAKYPYFPTAEIPKGTFNAQKEDVTTWALVMGEVASSELSADVAYDIVKAYFEGKEILGEAYSGAKDTDWIEANISLKGMPLHAGTVKYFKEIGVDVPAELIPPEF